MKKIRLNDEQWKKLQALPLLPIRERGDTPDARRSSSPARGRCGTAPGSSPASLSQYALMMSRACWACSGVRNHSRACQCGQQCLAREIERRTDLPRLQDRAQALVLLIEPVLMKGKVGLAQLRFEQRDLVFAELVALARAGFTPCSLVESRAGRNPCATASTRAPRRATRSNGFAACGRRHGPRWRARASRHMVSASLSRIMTAARRQGPRHRRLQPQPRLDLFADGRVV